MFWKLSLCPYIADPHFKDFLKTRLFGFKMTKHKTRLTQIKGNFCGKTVLNTSVSALQ